MAPTSQNPAHRFLLRAGTLLHRYGAPSYRLEAAMTEVCTALGVQGTFLYTPTALLAAIVDQQGEHTYLRRVVAEDVDIDKLLQFNQVLDRLIAGETTLAEAERELSEAASAGARYGLPCQLLAASVVCGSVAVLFGGGWSEMMMATLLGTLLFVLGMVAAKHGPERGQWIVPLSGFLAGLLPQMARKFVTLDHGLTTLAALILPLPGLSLTIALSELAAGHWSAGSARLAGAGVRLLTLVFGVGIAWQLGGSGQFVGPVGFPLPPWGVAVALLAAPVAIAVLFRAPSFLWPAIVATCAAGYLANRVGVQHVGPEFGAFFAALVVAACSNVYARHWRRPAMALLTPGILILVPGSIGYRSIVAMLASQTIQGVELAFAMLMIAISLVGGIVMANVILPPRRCL